MLPLYLTLIHNYQILIISHHDPLIRNMLACVLMCQVIKRWIFSLRTIIVFNTCCPKTFGMFLFCYCIIIFLLLILCIKWKFILNLLQYVNRCRKLFIHWIFFTEISSKFDSMWLVLLPCRQKIQHLKNKYF